jgi:hypothetical protein
VQANAVLVVGPESSGTRLLTRVLIEGCGLRGDYDHEQRWDHALPRYDGSSIVWRRSYPHFGHWPSLVALWDRLTSAGYADVRALITVRARYATVSSQLAAPHVRSAREADSNIQSAYRSILDELTSSATLPFMVVPYESLVLHPLETQRDVANFAGVDLLKEVAVSDENEKWSTSTLSMGKLLR